MEMGKKRNSIGTSLDEVDKTMYASFCNAANCLSQLYSHSMNHQKLSFQAGERHGLEKLHQWISRQEEEGTKVTLLDVLNYVQNELDYYGEEPLIMPRAPHQNDNYPSIQFAGSVLPTLSGSLGPATAAVGAQPEQCHQPSKNSVFSNALSSPIHRSLQNYCVIQESHLIGSLQPSKGTFDSNPNLAHFQNRSSISPHFKDSSMEM